MPSTFTDNEHGKPKLRNWKHNQVHDQHLHDQSPRPDLRWVFPAVREIEFTKEQLAEYDALLNDECNQKLKDFWQKKYRQDQGKNWELFYKRNETNFFKDRTWLTREFAHNGCDADMFDLQSLSKTDGTWKFIDIGCGVGNAVFPLLKLYPNCRAYEYDVSRRAINFLEERYRTDSVLGRIVRVGVWDLIKHEHPQEIWSPKVKIEGHAHEGHAHEGHAHEAEAMDVTVTDLAISTDDYRNMDVAMLMFVLSAIPIENVQTVIGRVVKTLRVGGLLLFRDYGRYDEKEIRFAKRSQSKLDDHFYVRQDGTLALYFDKDELDQNMSANGFEVVSSQYITRQFTNRKTGQKLNRCWLQAIYRRKS
ncbi:methyltransferase domain protein [Gregarina niphandrodes]|uniref:tRNA N(3)-methylcytidine methyltransferase n=1 Tax=Gregarina niphandrodes TaxID=110365 RepID=A0A023BBP4_GRENI|nr:methyltransferase domain protein [Gregarina niphandrodes]EZG79653.1 methyltransferase domain protein [Gregarina niphandrodes]|eukprot:XP_011134398.1 methyltransferase domain protein [Gregarina niphandrodes]